MRLLVYMYFNFHIAVIFHIFITVTLNCKVCMFELKEGPKEDCRKPN